jgi:hypothetical protein
MSFGSQAGFKKTVIIQGYIEMLILKAAEGRFKELDKFEQVVEQAIQFLDLNDLTRSIDYNNMLCQAIAYGQEVQQRDRNKELHLGQEQGEEVEV